jgi:hypothetical protein
MRSKEEAAAAVEKDLAATERVAASRRAIMVHVRGSRGNFSQKWLSHSTKSVEELSVADAVNVRTSSCTISPRVVYVKESPSLPGSVSNFSLFQEVEATSPHANGS